MKRRKRFNVRERQHRRYIRQVAALHNRSAGDAPTEAHILVLTPSFYRHHEVWTNRIQHAFHTRLRRTPPVPGPETCVVCGQQVDGWTWEEDPPPAGWQLDWEWWGNDFHCSRRCYTSGEEYAAKRSEVAR